MRSPALGTNELPHAAAAEAPVFTNIELPQGRPGRAIVVRFVPPAEEDDEHEGATAAKPSPQRADMSVIVAVAQDRGELNRIMTVLFWALLGIALFMAVGTVAVVSVEVRRGLAPLQSVAAAAARIDAQALDFRFSLDGLPRELQPICLRLNDSLERLQKAFERERRFTADVAHELRTPIAELRSLADVALKWDGDRATSLGYFKDAYDISRQMEQIVTALLSLARCQSGTATTARESVNLGALVHAAWDERRQEVAKRRLAVTFDMPDRLLLTIDRTMLCSIVNNLVSQRGPVRENRRKGRLQSACERLRRAARDHQRHGQPFAGRLAAPLRAILAERRCADRRDALRPGVDPSGRLRGGAGRQD